MVLSLGGLVVKRSGWVFVLALVTAVVFMSVVPLADQPETAFNEIDTPINETTPVSLWTRFAPPLQVPIVLPRLFRWTSEGKRTLIDPPSFAMHSHLSPLPELLCTFLI